MILAFSPQDNPELVGRHVNGDNGNNHIFNLRWGTQSENARDKFYHGTALIGELHPNTSLTEAQVVDLRRRRAAGESRQSIADDLKISVTAVFNIEKGRRWKHLNGQSIT